MRSKNSKSSTGRLSWMLSDVLKSKRAEGYVDTAVKVLIAVVIGALLLFGLYGLVGNVVIPTTTSKVSSLFNTTGVDGAGTGGGAGGGDTPVTPEPEIKRNGVIPNGGEYMVAGTGVTLSAGENFPVPADDDMYVESGYNDYMYMYKRGGGNEVEWIVAGSAGDQTEADALFSEIAGKPVTHLVDTFKDWTSLTTPPVIPSSVTHMDNTFVNCTSLTVTPTIPNSVTHMDNTFTDCTALVAATDIPNSVTYMRSVFQGCTALIIAPRLSDNATDISSIFNGCTSLATVPMIPSNAINMHSAFVGCTSLATVPEIPSSVDDMRLAFAGCAALTGTITIHANPTYYDRCFESTSESFTLMGSSTMLDRLGSTISPNYGD